MQGPMATINNGTSLVQVNVTKLRRPLEEIDLDGISASRERTEDTVLYQTSIQGTLDMIEYYSDSAQISAACVARGLRTTPPVDLRRKTKGLVRTNG